MLPLTLSLLAALAGAEPRDIDAQALEKVNNYRRTAGLAPVAVDAELSKGCRAHAEYLIRNFDDALAGKLNVHDEDMKAAGYTPEGRKAARASVITQMRGAEPLYGIDLWMASFYHRIPLLDPHLTKVGIGCANKDRDWFVVLDVKSIKSRGKDTIICFPVDGQKNVPLLFSLGAPEVPNPIPGNGDSKKAGHPITVSFFGTLPAVRDVRATLTDPDGNDVPVWLSSPEKPANKNYGRNTICLIPQAPLEPKTTYTVKVLATVNGKTWKNSWKFTTAARND